MPSLLDAQAYRSDAQRRRATGEYGARATDPNAEGMSAAEAALMAFGGPMGRAAGKAVTAAPRTVGGLLGGYFATAPSAMGAGDEDGLTNAQRDELRALSAKISSGRFTNGADRRTAEARVKELNGISADYARRQNEATQSASAAKVMEAEAARRDKLNAAQKPFSETFPVWNEVQPFMPGLIAAATMAPIAGRSAMGFNKAARGWEAAVQSGQRAVNPVDLASANSVAQSYARSMPPPSVGSTMKGYAVPAAIGAVEGAAIANAPETYNSFLPAENPERAAYAEYIKRLPAGHPEIARAQQIMGAMPETNPARESARQFFASGVGPLLRSGVGAMEGVGGAAFATTLGKGLQRSDRSLPRAETEALRSRVAGEGLDDATRAIQAESQAMGNVRPLPPQPQQLPPTPLPQPAPQRSLLEPQQPAPQALPAPQPGPSRVTALPPGVARFKDPALYGLGGLAAAQGSGQPDMAKLEMLVRAGILPPSVLDGMR